MKQPVPVKEKVTTIGEGGKRNWLYPASFHGPWLNRRRVVAWILIVIYFILPWTSMNGHQTILLNIKERKFAFFGIVFWPQDALIFWFFLVGILVFIILITAHFGRLWCGWACPQTVFLEHVFRKIETWIEGNATRRRRRDAGPMNWDKLWRKTTKYFIFIIISSHFANTAICYFLGTQEVLQMTMRPPTENWGWFSFMLFVNAIFFVDFAWFREQFCLIACPYGRFQSVLLDTESMIVGYDENRGEPRAIIHKNKNRTGGDCIDCSRCIQVCPTGIDIRMGLQMECVNCTACMDACDEVMGKVGFEKGLIRYTSIAELKEARTPRFIRPRTMVYTVLFLALWAVGGYLLMNKKEIVVQMLRPKGTSFTLTESERMVTNLFHVKASNKTEHEIVLVPEVPAGYEIVAAFRPWRVPPQQVVENQVFIRKKRENFSSFGKETLRVKFMNQFENRLVFDREITLIGPAK